MTPMKPIEAETKGERWANTITHGIGAALSAAALGVLITVTWQSGDVRRLVTVGIYGVSLLMLYLASTCFHACRGDRARHWFQVADHASIYFLIAGSYTPFLVVLVRGAWGYSMLAIVWGLALAGGVLKVFFVRRFEALSTAVYVLMGWLALVAIKPFIQTIPSGALWLIVAGGVAYTAGVVFFVWERLRFNHAIWHLFVMTGSACHFFAVLFYVVPRG